MSREIVIDTETTGLEPSAGHRIVEIACVELENLLPTGRHFHRYVDPEREIDVDAQRVHGISNAFLVGKPRFADPEVADAFLEFIDGADLIAHNAAFDRGFVDHELLRAARPSTLPSRWVDTLALAQKRFPGMYNSLDALCKRFKISLAEREKHGALVDARLLAGVYLELRGGRECALDLSPVSLVAAASVTAARAAYGVRPRPLATRLTDAERHAHLQFLAVELNGAVTVARFRRVGRRRGSSGVPDRGRHGLSPSGRVNSGEIHRLQHERWETTFAGQIGDHTPREREEVTRAFDHQHRFEIGGRHAHDLEQTRIHHLQVENRVGQAGGAGRQLQLDLIETILPPAGVELDAQINLRLRFATAQRFRGAGILEGKVADILGQDPDAGLCIACVWRGGAGQGVGHISGVHMFNAALAASRQRPDR